MLQKKLYRKKLLAEDLNKLLTTEENERRKNEIPGAYVSLKNRLIQFHYNNLFEKKKCLHKKFIITIYIISGIFTRGKGTGHSNKNWLKYIKISFKIISFYSYSLLITIFLYQYRYNFGIIEHPPSNRKK